MENDNLIYNTLLELKEDIGSMKSKDEALEGWMTSLDSKITTIEKNCGNAFSLQLTKNQIILGGTIIGTIAAYFGWGGVQ